MIEEKRSELHNKKQQEPRLLSNYSQDENMINAYKEGKDLYATIASGVYSNTYWDNMEHFEDGSPNPEGKKRRNACKSLLLGIMYGRGVASIAEQINGTVKEAQAIVDNFYNGFPKVKKWMDETQINAKKNGYVEDSWGRRRRLPDIQLPKYEIKLKTEQKDSAFNPILYCKGILETKKPNIISKYEKILETCKSKKDYEAIKAQADKENVIIHDNSGFISQAERQSVNARIQGGAATMSKKAMIAVYRDNILRDLGFKLLIAVHDELIGECPIENQDAVADRLTYIMKHAADDVCNVPFKCDATIESVWYESDYNDNLINDYNKRLKNNISKEEAFNQICVDYCECTPEHISKILSMQAC